MKNKKHKPITQSRIDQLSNDISEDIASGTKADLRQVVKYWMEKSDKAIQQEHVKRLDEMLRILKPGLTKPVPDPEEERRRQQEYDESVNRARRNIPPPPPFCFPLPSPAYPYDTMR